MDKIDLIWCALRWTGQSKNTRYSIVNVIAPWRLSPSGYPLPSMVQCWFSRLQRDRWWIIIIIIIIHIHIHIHIPSSSHPYCSNLFHHPPGIKGHSNIFSTKDEGCCTAQIRLLQTWKVALQVIHPTLAEWESLEVAFKSIEISYAYMILYDYICMWYGFNDDNLIIPMIMWWSLNHEEENSLISFGLIQSISTSNGVHIC